MRDMLVRMGIFGELISFLWKRKLYWLIPMMLMLVVIIIIVILGSNPATQPFIYSLW
ncbi:MAG: hypothetical protein H6671_02395 [Anaerolineaceae bacterium]|nr:hypothetical protein [Anaerolineaceae bacterium]